MFCKKGVLKNFAKFTGKHLCQSLIFNKVVDLAQVISCEFWKFLRSLFIENTSSGSVVISKNSLKEGSVHSTSWKFSLYFVYIFIADWNFLTKFCSSDPSFNRNILTPLYLKSETSAHAQLCDYSFIHTIYTFHGMVLAGDSH